MAETVAFFVPGVPAPGGSKKGYVRGKRVVIVETCKRTPAWREKVAGGAAEAFREPMRGTLAFTFTFTMPRPKHHFWTGRRSGVLRPDAPLYHTVAPDATKLTRSTEDAMKGIAWLDDSQVARQQVVKLYGDRPGVLIQITRLD